MASRSLARSLTPRGVGMRGNDLGATAGSPAAVHEVLPTEDMRSIYTPGMNGNRSRWGAASSAPARHAASPGPMTLWTGVARFRNDETTKRRDGRQTSPRDAGPGRCEMLHVEKESSAQAYWRSKKPTRERKWSELRAKEWKAVPEAQLTGP